jgi:flagellar FliJ protein
MFTFRFETLLTTRRHAEETLQRDLSDARRALSLEQAAVREGKKSLRRCIQELQLRRSARFRAADIQLRAAWLQRLELDLDARQQRAAAAERRVHQKRLELIEAMKRRKMLETLKEKERDRHLKAMEERERKFIDDVAGRRSADARRRP